uniref:Uncharacterized protein n=1 Tax=Oryza rufipogon TaxID=4529 RepID=A0A0E0MXR6_ORYRU
MAGWADEDYAEIMVAYWADDGSCRRARRDHPARHRRTTLKEKSGEDTPVAFLVTRRVVGSEVPLGPSGTLVGLSREEGHSDGWSYEGSPAQLAGVLDCAEFEGDAEAEDSTPCAPTGVQQ